MKAIFTKVSNVTFNFKCKRTQSCHKLQDKLFALFWQKNLGEKRLNFYEFRLTIIKSADRGYIDLDDMIE